MSTGVASIGRHQLYYVDEGHGFPIVLIRCDLRHRSQQAR